MSSFKDRDGRAWDIEISVGSVKKVQSRMNIDLVKILLMRPGKNPDGTDSTMIDCSGCMEILEDPIRLANLLACLCEKQMAERNIDEEAFGYLLKGDVLYAAGVAFMEAAADFFQGERRVVIRNLLKTRIRLEEKLDKVLSEAMEKIGTESDTPSSSGS